MNGLITTKHLFTNAGDIVREFGLGCYTRCLFNALVSRRRVTFLELACKL